MSRLSGSYRETHLGTSNHPTIIFSEFMGKEWRKVQTDGGKGVGSEGCDQELPCHMIQQIGASITQETGAGRVMRVD